LNYLLSPKYELISAFLWEVFLSEEIFTFLELVLSLVLMLLRDAVDNIVLETY